MDRKIVVYGGTGGMGSAVARKLHAQGDELHLVARDEERLAALATDLNATYTVGDVTDPALFETVAQQVGDPLHGLVYAVGTINLARLSRLTTEDFLDDYRINAMGAALAVQAHLKALRKAGGNASVVLYSSVAANQGFAMHASIGMAKGAVSGLTLSLAAELAPRIRVNAIAPSLTDTPLASGLVVNEKMREAIANYHALPRLGTAEDMAALTVFLLSPEADWITGQIIGVDGGRSTLRIRS